MGGLVNIVISFSKLINNDYNGYYSEYYCGDYCADDNDYYDYHENVSA